MKASTSFPNLQALKQSTDLVAVVQSRGIKLTKQGNDFVGLCPFHEEKTPSFHVTPSKNLFHCFGCGAAGSVIDFVMKKGGLNKQQAIDWLVKQSNGAICRAENGRDGDSVIADDSYSMTDANRTALLKRVVAFYAKTLLSDRDGYDYLKTRNLSDPTMLEVFQVGYCNGTLHRALPKEGEVVEQLKVLGILNAKGHEHFYGRVIIPIFDAAGNICGLYGRLVESSNVGHRTPNFPRHLYLCGEHRGVFNGASAKTNQTLIISEAILDAMSLWQAGFRNVISLYGAEGWTADHETLIRENGITDVYLALDNDPTGKRETPKLKEKLSSLVKNICVIEWPDGVKDAVDFFFSRSATDFEQLLKAANPQSEQKSETTERLGEEAITMTPSGFVAAYGVRRYELMAIEKPSAARLKATVKALSTVDNRLSTGTAARFHIDTVDFYLSRSRRNFIVEAARLFREMPEVIEMDVNRLIVQLESYVEKRLVEQTPRITLVSESDKLEGLRLGRNPDLVGEILRDMEKLGIIGEKINALIGYIVMTSRKMDDPLALLTLSSSGAGKSHLQDTILSLCPEEDLIKVTSLSDRALFYKGEDSLRHKVLAVEKEAGASGAHYPIRNLISSKKLVIETTIKNPLTGRMETQVNMVQGPTAVFLTTTNPETNAETRSRFILASVDESAEQTRAILAAQRQSHTLEGLLRRKQRGKIVTRHHAFQRLLKPLAVVNPFEPLLFYGDDRLLFRRDNPKYLHLILIVAFLYQMQRAVKSHPELGDCIEATLDDIAIANEVATELFGLSLDDLSSPSRQLLRLISDHVAEKAQRLGVKAEKVEFSRRELWEALGWSEYRLRSHLRELAELEYLVPVSGRFGQLYCYRLIYDTTAEEGKRFIPGLKSVEQLRQEAETIGLTSLEKVEPRWLKKNLDVASLVASNEGLRGGFSSKNWNDDDNLVASGKEHLSVLRKNGQKGACVSIVDQGVP